MSGSAFGRMLFLVLVVCFVGVLVWQRLSEVSGLRIDKTNTAVVTQLQELSRLETASFTVEKVIDASTDDEGIQAFLFGDRLLLIAHGVVIAGYDLSTFEANAVEVEGERLTLSLPAPEILVTTLDNQKTRVYERDQGILTDGDPDLEATARLEAETAIREAACESGILDQARDNAHKQLQALFEAVGFAEVVISSQEGSCL